MSRVYRPAAGPRGWPRENHGAVCQVAPGIQESRREVLPWPRDPCQAPRPARLLWQSGRGCRVRARLPLRCSHCLRTSAVPIPPLLALPPSALGTTAQRGLKVVIGCFSAGGGATREAASGVPPGLPAALGRGCGTALEPGRGSPRHVPEVTSRIWQELGVRSSAAYFTLTGRGQACPPRPDLRGKEGSWS